MKSKRELIKEIADNINVRLVGYGTWEIESTIIFPMKAGDDISKTLRVITHNEDDYTGIFNGEVYNPLGGFDTAEELEAVAKECEMTVETFLKHAWTDSANEDNYESKKERNLRLAERLWDKCVEPWDMFPDIYMS